MAKRHLDSSPLCPVCESTLQLSGHVRIGQKITCRRCGTPLTILEQKPLELAVATDKPQGK